MEAPWNASWEKELQVDHVPWSGSLPSTQGMLVLITRRPVHKITSIRNMVKYQGVAAVFAKQNNKNTEGGDCRIWLHKISAVII